MNIFITGDQYKKVYNLLHIIKPSYILFTVQSLSKMLVTISNGVTVTLEIDVNIIDKHTDQICIDASNLYYSNEIEIVEFELKGIIVLMFCHDAEHNTIDSRKLTTKFAIVQNSAEIVNLSSKGRLTINKPLVSYLSLCGEFVTFDSGFIWSNNRTFVSRYKTVLEITATIKKSLLQLLTPGEYDIYMSSNAIDFVSRDGINWSLPYYRGVISFEESASFFDLPYEKVDHYSSPSNETTFLAIGKKLINFEISKSTRYKLIKIAANNVEYLLHS